MSGVNLGGVHLDIALKMLQAGAVFNVTMMEGKSVMLETTVGGYAATMTVKQFVKDNPTKFDNLDRIRVESAGEAVSRGDLVEIAMMVVPGWEAVIGAEPLHGTLRIPNQNPMRCSFFLFTDYGGDLSASGVAQPLTPPEQQRFASGFSGRLGCAVRILPMNPLPLDGLRLTQRSKAVADAKGGLVLIVGSPGMGKSTTAAAYIDHRNKTLSGTIVTAETPIEVPIPSKASIVTPREVGVNVGSVYLALKDAERNFAHSVLVGEIQTEQDQTDTFNAARRGLFVVTTSFANSAVGAVKALVADLDRTGANGADLVVSTLLAVIFQVRLPSVRPGQWEFAYEALVVQNQPTIAKLINDRDWLGLQTTVNSDREASLNASMSDLVARKRVLRENALAQAYDKEDAGPMFARAAQQAGILKVSQ